MGTRCLTLVYDGDSKRPLVNMYRQMDGYPSGHGKELADFLEPIKMVNGISRNTTDEHIANGAGCLAAQIVSYFKEDVGGFYLNPPVPGDYWQDYEYHVHADEGGIKVRVFDGRYTPKKKPVFEGDVAGFKAFCEKEE